jgi:hypothetical protein
MEAVAIVTIIIGRLHIVHGYSGPIIAQVSPPASCKRAMGPTWIPLGSLGLLLPPARDVEIDLSKGRAAKPKAVVASR